MRKPGTARNGSEPRRNGDGTTPEPQSVAGRSRGPLTPFRGWGPERATGNDHDLTPFAMTLPEPPSANRWWRNVNGRMVTSKVAREYKAGLAQLGGARMLAGPVKVTLVWYRGRKSGDLDKRVGVLLDALQGVAYANDGQIVELIARREDDPRNPRVDVRVEAA